jgi:hypothetical protein
MAHEEHTSAGRVMSIEAVAVRVVCEGVEPARQSSAVDSSLNLTKTPMLGTQSRPEIVESDEQGSPFIGTEQIGFPMSKASAVWTGEIKTPNREEALNALMPHDRGGPRIAILAGMLIGASGLAWWAGLLDSYRFFNFNPASPFGQGDLLDRAPLDIDQQASSGTTQPGQ